MAIRPDRMVLICIGVYCLAVDARTVCRVNDRVIGLICVAVCQSNSHHHAPANFRS